MEKLVVEVLDRRAVYPQACSKLFSKTIDLEVKLLLSQKVVLPPCETWDSYKHSIGNKEEIKTENDVIIETLDDLQALDKEIPVSIDKVISKKNDVLKVLKVLKRETYSEILKKVMMQQRNECT